MTEWRIVNRPVGGGAQFSQQKKVGSKKGGILFFISIKG
jgi:hypothetical protein